MLRNTFAAMYSTLRLRALHIFTGSLVLVSSALNLSAQTAGYYKLQVAFGHYERHDSAVGQADGIPVIDTSSIEFDDSAINSGAEENYLVILENGEVTGHWTQHLNFLTSWESEYFGATFGINTSLTTLNVDVTGTVLSATAESVVLQLDALIDCNSSKTSSWALGGSNFRFGPPTASWNATDIALPLVVTATRKPDGGMLFSIPTATTILPVLASASPALPSEAGIEIREFALSGVAVQQTYSVLNIGAWSNGPTHFDFAAPANDLGPVFAEYFLLDVAAPYGFVVSGFLENEGSLTARFRYGTETLELPIVEGRALAPLDYGDAATVVEADILLNGSVEETLTRPLQKLAVPLWAEPVTAWSSQPGVIYTTTLDWPVSLATSRTLENASILTGLWGITGAAESEMEVNAHSLGTPTLGALQGRVNFEAGGKQFGFTLGGRHTATLNASGLSLAGNCETSPFSIPLLETNITPLSLVPGLQSAVSAVHPFFQRLIRGTGLGLRSQLSLSASGGYVAGPLDDSPMFNSGSIIGAVDVSARLNILPEMMRDFLYLGIEGGGGLETTIQLAPSVEMTSLGGYLYFTGTASLFGLNAEVTHDYTFGDQAPPLASRQSKSRVAKSLNAASLQSVALASEPIPEGESLAPRSHLAVMMNLNLFSTVPGVAVASVPVPGQPAPATKIAIRNLYRETGDDLDFQWNIHDSTYSLANLAPTVGNSPRVGRREERQAIVWSHSTTEAVNTAQAREDFANGMELGFLEFDSARNRSGVFFDLTSNSLCDFGASIPQVSRAEPLRVFWARSHGTDFTGSTTPLTLHTRRWSRTTDPILDWTPEVQAVGNLSHVIDWKAFIISATDAVIVVTLDGDGNFETLNDSELWLVREINEVWSAPVRITNNSVADEQPVMFRATTADPRLRMAWRQGSEIVYIRDILTDLTPQVLLPATVAVGPGFSKAVFGTQNSVQGGKLVLAWPEGGSIAYAFEDSANAVPGGLMAQPRHVPLNDDTITGVGATIRFASGSTYLEAITLATAATAGSSTSVPVTTQDRLSFDLVELTATEKSNYAILTPQGKLAVALGEEIYLQVAVEDRAGTMVQWLLNGQEIPGATSGIYKKSGATSADEGTYTLRITDSTGTFDVAVGSLTVAETFAAWALANQLTVPLNTREADADNDGAPNDLEYLFGTDPKNASSRPVTTYAASNVEDFGVNVDSFTFNVRAKSTDCDYAIEHSRDLLIWTDLRYEESPTIDGTLNQTIRTISNGTYSTYLVLIENANYAPILTGKPSFCRVRMVRP